MTPIVHGLGRRFIFDFLVVPLSCTHELAKVILALPTGVDETEAEGHIDLRFFLKNCSRFSGGSRIDVVMTDIDNNSQQSIAFSDTMMDMANWWCHYILQNSKLELFDEFSDVLEYLAPIQEGSALSIRLHCLVVWQELLKQTSPKTAISADNDAEAKHPPPLESRDFEAVQDKLVLLHTRYFLHDMAAMQEYQEVVRTIRVHHELSILYGKLKEDGDNPEEVNAALDEALSKGRDDIYFGDNYQIPAELQTIVVKENGLSAKQRLQGIEDVINNDDSELAVKWLLLKTRMVLLHWCEREVPGGVPYLVLAKYRDVGVITRDPGRGIDNAATQNNSAANGTETEASEAVAVARSKSTTQQSVENGPAQEYATEIGIGATNEPQQGAPPKRSRQSPFPPTLLLGQKRKYNADDESQRSNTTNGSQRLAAPSEIMMQHRNRSGDSPVLEATRGQERTKTTSLSPSQASEARSTSAIQRKLVVPKRGKKAVAWTTAEVEVLMEGVQMKGTNWIAIKSWAGARLATKSKKDMKERYAAMFEDDENSRISENGLY